MPFGLICEVCERPFTFFENINLALRALGRCIECDQRLRAAVENLQTGIEEDFKQTDGITEEIEYLVYEATWKPMSMPIGMFRQPISTSRAKKRKKCLATSC
jgi:hypothetical protein